MSKKPEAITLDNLDDVTGGRCGRGWGRAAYGPAAFAAPGKNWRKWDSGDWRSWYRNSGYYSAASYNPYFYGRRGGRGYWGW